MMHLKSFLLLIKTQKGNNLLQDEFQTRILNQGLYKLQIYVSFLCVKTTMIIIMFTSPHAQSQLSADFA